jgi:cAMP phosphodiesterase
LTSFIVNERLAIDGGSIGFALLPSEMGAIHHVIVTHAHSDHTASLPIYIAESFTSLHQPITIYATAEVVKVLREFVFNDQVWPNFEKIPLMNGSGPTLQFQTLELNKQTGIAGLQVTPVPVNHIVPTVGLLVEDEHAALVFTSDTYSTDDIWALARQKEQLKAVFVDVSFPNELGPLAASSKHLTPELLAIDLQKLDREVDVYAVHIKPSNRADVIRELQSLNNPKIFVGVIGRLYEWE